jgi:hypothetical protein
LNHIPVSWDCDIYQHTCSLFIIAYYNVWFFTGDGPFSLYLSIPQYGYLTSSTCLLLLLLLLLRLFQCDVRRRNRFLKQNISFSKRNL